MVNIKVNDDGYYMVNGFLMGIFHPFFVPLKGDISMGISWDSMGISGDLPSGKTKHTRWCPSSSSRVQLVYVSTITH